jgi:hypothetical protein
LKYNSGLWEGRGPPMPQIPFVDKFYDAKILILSSLSYIFLGGKQTNPIEMRRVDRMTIDGR